VTVPSSVADSHWWLDRSSQVRAMVLGSVAAQQAHPDKTIVLDGITSALYDDAVGESAFYAAGLDYVYLTPNAIVSIHPTVNEDFLPKIALDPAILKNAITHEQVVVYSVVGDHLRNITEMYERSPAGRSILDANAGQEPRRVEVGNPLFAYLLGPEWFSLESGIRWMSRRATVRLGGPDIQDQLVLEGYCPDWQWQNGPVHLSVSVDGISLGTTEIGNPEGDFHRIFAVPQVLAGRSSVAVAIGIDHTLREPGGRELGLVFGTIAFRRSDPRSGYR
jgi:hypothetical protein